MTAAVACCDIYSNDISICP